MPHTQLVQIEKPIYGGAFLARVEGKAVFVPLTLPGEQARVRIVEDKRGYATAEAEEIVAAAPERIAPAAAHFGACGGCSYQHADYETQLAFKQAILRETLERGGVRAPAEIDVLAGEPWGYRNRIRLAFDAQGNPGYRGRRSHAVVPISECPIAAPLLDRGRACLRRDCAESRSRAAAHRDFALLQCGRDALLVSILHRQRRESSRSKILRAHLASEFRRCMGVELVVEGLQRASSPRTRRAMGRDFPRLSRRRISTIAWIMARSSR